MITASGIRTATPTTNTATSLTTSAGVTAPSIQIVTVTNIVNGTGNASTCTIGGTTSKLSHDLTHQSHLQLMCIIFSAVWFWVVFSITTIIGIISGVCVCCFCCSCCIVAAKRKNRTQQGRVLYTTPTAYQQGTTPNNY